MNGEAMAEHAAALRDRGETGRARALLAEAVELLEREQPELTRWGPPVCGQPYRRAMR